LSSVAIKFAEAPAELREKALEFVPWRYHKATLRIFCTSKI
jgi:hypothetical protein